MRGYRFSPKNLNKMLKNTAYVGEYVYGDYQIEGGMPRLVEDEVFKAVQRRLGSTSDTGRSRRTSSRRWAWMHPITG